jgi:hypothetical protein
VRLWVKLDDDSWQELANDEDAVVAVRTDETSTTVAEFVVKTRPQKGEAIAEIRVSDPSGSGPAQWSPAPDGLSAQAELELPAGTYDAYVQAPFKVQVRDAHGDWWGKDPFIRVERVMYGGTTRRLHTSS